MKAVTLPGQLTAGNVQWTHWLRIAIGGILAFNGFAGMFGLLANSRALDLADPLLGFPCHPVSLAVAAAELLLAALFLLTNRRTLSLWLAVWLAVNFLVYRTGLWTMGWHHPYGWLQGLMNSLNTSPLRADVVSLGTTGLLLVGSVTLIWHSRRAMRAKPATIAGPARDAGSSEALVRTLKIACTQCGGHIEFSTNSFGAQVPCPHCQTVIVLKKSATIKMSCAACDGHITFPAHALGEKIACPHCAKEITLKEPG